MKKVIWGKGFASCTDIWRLAAIPVSDLARCEVNGDGERALIWGMPGGSSM